MNMATDTTRGEGRNYKKRTRWQKYHCFALSRIEVEKKIRIVSVHENSNRHHKEEKKQLRKELPHCVPTRLQKKKKNARRPWQQVKKQTARKVHTMTKYPLRRRNSRTRKKKTEVVQTERRSYQRHGQKNYRRMHDEVPFASKKIQNEEESRRK